MGALGFPVTDERVRQMVLVDTTTLNLMRLSTGPQDRRAYRQRIHSWRLGWAGLGAGETGVSAARWTGDRGHQWPGAIQQVSRRRNSLDPRRGSESYLL